MKSALIMRSAAEVETWLTSWVAEELALEAGAVDTRAAFLSYGMNSVQAMMLVGDLEDRLGLRLPPTLIWDYPTIEALARHVVDTAAAQRNGTAGRDAAEPVTHPGLSGGADPSRQPDAETLLANLDQLSEEEMDALLQNYAKASQ